MKDTKIMKGREFSDLSNKVIFKSHELVKELIETTTTQNGLTVKATIIDKVYMIGRKVVDGFKKSMRILFDDHLGRWNYVAVPQYG